jgi:DNA repair protein SbcC/Rad50
MLDDQTCGLVPRSADLVESPPGKGYNRIDLLAPWLIRITGFPYLIMIPLHIKITGFLSYRDTVEADFRTVSLACISGANGAGKSSLLDAITWALFGQARKRDDSLINTQASAAEVRLVFSYENGIYCVQRSKPRDKTTLLDFMIWQGESWEPDSSLGRWKTLSGATLRETEACIQQTLRLDYDTFVNASFFLQGKADLFTQQRPGERKRILSSILGLEVWEEYKQRAVDRRKALEGEIQTRDGRLAEINSELSEEAARKQRLEQIESDLERLSSLRQSQEKSLESLRVADTALQGQRRLAAALGRQLEAARQRQDDLSRRLAERRREHQEQAGLLENAVQIEAAYRAWQQARQDLERWEESAGQFREQEKRRQAPLTEINTARTRLEEQRQTFLRRKGEVEASEREIPGLEKEIEAARTAQQEAEAELQKKEQLEAALQEARQRQADARAENPRLKQEMEEIKERIERLNAASGADCPLCGQPLSTAEKENLVASLAAQGKEMGDRYRTNQALMKEADGLVRSLEGDIRLLSQAEAALRSHQRSLDQHTARLDGCHQQVDGWRTEELPLLEGIERQLEEESYAAEARHKLSGIDAELKAIGYDAAAHDQVRRAEAAGRPAEHALRSLESARAALDPLEREIAGLEGDQQAAQAELDAQQAEYDQAAAALAQAEAQAPDIDAAERELLNILEQENRLRLDVGAARQKVLVLKDLKARSRSLQAEREELAKQVGQYRQLERAFGKDGVPALLIEQALPQIEARSNELLDRLSGGSMSVRFVTQAAYKDKKRDDFRETLDIQISDGAGTRDYEMFSGGEAFRVNFAIRLALAEVLAQRAGARLQTLVIDEGFGSQDALGRQRLVEAINMVHEDFSKILVITHIDELKDAFPSRIEVEKTPRGSTVRVI